VALTARYLVDKSALARMPKEPVRKRLGPIIEGGLAATCGIIDLEVLYSARAHRDHSTIRKRRASAYQNVDLSQSTFDRALEIQGELSKTGHHRVAIPDLIIAAAAEQAGLVVLHYDRDYDIIAGVTSQETEWVVPAGTVD
jgi:predicted nucleic acid-binding protein